MRKAQLIRTTVSVLLLAGLPLTASATERSFHEVRDRVYATPLQELPFYSRFSFMGALASVLRVQTALLERARLTVIDPNDFIEAAPKVLHPMGVCATADWKIDTDSGATGLLSAGTQVPAMVRLSVASNQVTSDPKTKRVIAIAVKLFPSTNPNTPVTTRNFLTADQTGLDGSNRRSFFFGDQADDKIYFSNNARGDGFAAKLGFILFDRIDGPSNYRPLYQLSEISGNNIPVARPLSPTEVLLIPRISRRIEPLPADFRDEIRSYKSGEIKFDIVIPSQAGSGAAKKIGTVTLGEPVVSKACDQELHFHHHPMNRALDQTQTANPDLQLDQSVRPSPFAYRNGKINETVQDRWEHRGSSFRTNSLFHEVKYFNFVSPEVTGAITYMVVSPKWSQQLIVSANFSHNGKVSAFRKSYDLKCVDASVFSAGVDICHEGGIEVLGEGRLRLVQKTGPVQWDLTFDAAAEDRSDVISEFEFNKILPYHLDHVTSFSGWFHWVTNFRSSQAQGSVTLTGTSPTVLNVAEATGYHDQHWGVWNPYVQPMRWLHFAGLDTDHKKVDIALGEFTQNNDSRAGLTLIHDGRRVFFGPENYRVEVLEAGHVAVIPVSQGQVTTVNIDPWLQSGSHSVVRKLRIVTTTEPFFEVTADLNSAVAIDGGGKGGFLLNEQSGHVSFRFLNNSGSARAEGTGFYMETSSRSK